MQGGGYKIAHSGPGLLLFEGNVHAHFAVTTKRQNNHLNGQRITRIHVDGVDLIRTRRRLVCRHHRNRATQIGSYVIHPHLNLNLERRRNAGTGGVEVNRAVCREA